MDNFAQLIQDAFEYYDKNMIENDEKYRTYEYVSYEDTPNTLIFYDKNNNKVNQTTYEIIGQIMYSSGVWIWGWSNSRLDKLHIPTSKRLLEYGLELENILRSRILKTALITSRIYITSPIQIEMFVALASFLSKRPFVYRLDDNFKSKRSAEHNYRIPKIKNPSTSYYIILDHI